MPAPRSVFTAASASRSSARRLPQAGPDVRRDLLGTGRPGDHAAHRRLGGQPADGDVEDARRRAPSANACSASIRSQSAFASRWACFSALEAAARRGPLAAAVLAGEQPVGEREVGDQAHPEVARAPGPAPPRRPGCRGSTRSARRRTAAARRWRRSSARRRPPRRRSSSSRRSAPCPPSTSSVSASRVSSTGVTRSGWWSW